MDHLNEVILETMPMESGDNEVPFYTIKSFGKVQFKKESFVIPSAKVEGVDNLLGYDNVRSNMSSLDKGSLSGVDDVGQMLFEAVGQGFSDDFVGNVAKTYGPEVSRSLRSMSLGNKSYESSINICWHVSRAVEICYQLMYVLCSPTPCCLVESCIESIRSWRRIASHPLYYVMCFVQIWKGNCVNIVNCRPALLSLLMVVIHPVFLCTWRIASCENFSKVGIERLSELLRCGAVRAIRICEVGNTISSGSFLDGLVEERSVSVTFDGPGFFISLSMENLLFGENVVVLMDEFFLQAMVLEVRWLGLLLEKLLFNGLQLIIKFGFGPSPFSEIKGKVFGFVMKRTVTGFVPALLCHVLKVLLKKPPVFKSKNFVSFLTS